MSEPGEFEPPRYLGSELPADVDADGMLPLVRISISAVPDPELIDIGKLALVVGVEVGHPLPADVLNARQVFTLLHRLLPNLERKVRAEWVEHRKVCPGGDAE